MNIDMDYYLVRLICLQAHLELFLGKFVRLWFNPVLNSDGILKFLRWSFLLLLNITLGLRRILLLHNLSLFAPTRLLALQC